MSIAGISGACFSPKDTTDLPCTDDNGCDADQICVLKICKPRMLGTGEDASGEADSGAASTTGDSSGSGTTRGESTSSTSSSSSEDGSSSESGDPPGCSMGSELQVLDPTPASRRVMIVADRSAPLSELWDHDATPSTPERVRWSVAHEWIALGLQNFEETNLSVEVSVGLKLVPSDAASVAATGRCNLEPGMNIEAGADRATILAELPPAGTDPAERQGASMMGPALAQTAQYLRDNFPYDPKTIIVVTSAAPACASTPHATPRENFDANLVDEVRELNRPTDGQEPVATHIYDVGAPDTERGALTNDGLPEANPHQALAELAQQGRDGTTLLQGDARLAESLKFGRCVFPLEGLADSDAVRVSSPQTVGALTEVTSCEALPQGVAADEAFMLVGGPGVELCGAQLCRDYTLGGRSLEVSYCREAMR